MNIKHYFKYCHSKEDPINTITLKVDGEFYWDAYKVYYISIFGINIPFWSECLRAKEIEKLVKKFV